MISTLLVLLLAAPVPAGAIGLAPQGGGPVAPEAREQEPGAEPETVPVDPPPEPADQDVPTIQEQGDFYIVNVAEDPEDQLSLEVFVKLVQEATGLNFTYDQATARALQDARLFLFGTKRIPKADFYRFFQIMLFINDFVAVEVGPPHIAVYVIQHLGPGAQARQQSRWQKAEYVLPEELEEYADQPATLIMTAIHLPNTDVRPLSTAMRSFFPGDQSFQMMAAGERALIVQGFGTTVASLAKLLLLVDRESAAIEVSPVFDVIPLEYASAQDVADLVDQLLEAAGGARPRRPQQPGQQEGRIPGFPAEGAEAKILVDARTNSLLVMALPDEMPRIKDLVAQLDVQVVEPERNFHIYSLQNVKAADLAEVLKEFLEGAREVPAQEGATGGRAPGAQGAGRGEVVVVPDEDTNSLLIAAGKTRYEEILELLRQLDRRQDQVLIETALISLTGSTFRDLGFELAAADVSGDGGFGITNFGLSSLVDLDDDGFNETRVPNLGTGVTAGILDGNDVNLPVLLAAFQRVSGSNVLNVPSVLVNNNRVATVTSRDEQPTTQITATGGVGGQTQENFAGFEEAGITLTITPSISAARYLRLDIQLVVSNFLGSVQGAIPPPRITRELITTVNVPDGDTMIIGGIISDNATQTRDQVPWLGDIPVLGALFRRDTNTKDRTTLYFFVTPHILHDRDFADLAEISYRKKLEAAEVIGKDRVRVVDPAFGADGPEALLEPFQVPLYRSPEAGEVGSEAVGMDPVRREELLREARPEPLPGEETVEEPMLLDDETLGEEIVEQAEEPPPGDDEDDEPRR